MSEAARIALLQEMMRDAKRNERGGLVACVLGIVVGVAGFSTLPLAGNSFNLGILGVAISSIGFGMYLYYARLYSTLVGQLANLAFISATPCPKCRKALPKGEFDFCPFCGASLKTEPQTAEAIMQNEALTIP